MNVLAIGAHWDDVEIGCALSLDRLRRRGANVYGVVLTDSAYTVRADGHVRSEDRAAEEGRRAFDSLGIVLKETTTLPNLLMAYDQQVMREIESIVDECSIDLAFTHWFGDHNTDHAAAWEISRVALRRVRGLLLYQSNSYADNVSMFVPHFYWGFSEAEYARKQELMAMHETEWEYRKERWQREIFDRERFWGYQCGHDYAEAFMVSRLLDTSEQGWFQGR